MGEQIVFGFAAASALVCGTLVITLKGPFRATVALIGTLLSVAVLFLLMSAPFVAAIQVIVYAGAIVVLFLFVIAYLGERPLTEVGDRLARYRFAAWLAVIGLAIQGIVVLANIELPGRARRRRGRWATSAAPRPSAHAFLDRFIVPFEATSLALLVAAVGAVLLAKRAVRGGGRRDDDRGACRWCSTWPSRGRSSCSACWACMTRRNPLLLLLAVELLLNSANVALVGFSRYWNVTDGQVFALVVMVVAAAEVVIGLGLVVAVFRQRLALDVDQMSSLKG